MQEEGKKAVGGLPPSEPPISGPRKGGTWRAKHFLVWVPDASPNPEKGGFQIVIEKRKIRRAVKRNRWRRQIRAILRKEAKRLVLPPLVRLKLHTPETLTFQEINQELTQLLMQSGLMK